MTAPLDKVTTNGLPLTALATVAVYTMLPPSVIAVPFVADDKVTVVGLMVSAIWAVAVAVAIVSCSKLPPVALVIVAARVEASR